MGMLALATLARGNGLDTGNRVDRLAISHDALALDGAEWLRIRATFELATSIDRKQVAETRRALVGLRAAGRRTCVFLRWDAKTWSRVQKNDRPQSPGGFRATDFRLDRELTRERGQLPMDLRLAYERCRALAETYSDVIDAWEVENEPDLAFVPENAEHYTAFLKACYLGFKAGASKSDRSTISRDLSIGTSSYPCGPLVIMAPMGLPPGSWFERFAANGGLSYTDGFNFHYYGYAEDFTGVYRTFETAVLTASNQHTVRPKLAKSSREGTELPAERDPPRSLPPQIIPVKSNLILPKSAGISQEKAESAEPDASRLPRLSTVQKNASRTARLPVFATEIGYGMLGMRERDTKAARLRQWRWFKSVGEQVARLELEAPMAFYLQRYHEATGLEFGLTVPRTSPKHFDLYARGGWFVGGNYFTPPDFGAAKPENWMHGIGQRVAGGDATPALAWWLAQTNTTRPKHTWSISVPVPAPVVIDLIARENVYSEHRYNGYFVRGTGIETTGSTDIVLYNFSESPVKGRLLLPACMKIAQSSDIKLLPMERRVIPAIVTVEPRVFASVTAEVTFESDEISTASFATQFYPQFDGRQVGEEWPLTKDRVARSPFSSFEKNRWRATEEAPKYRNNECWAQEGAVVKWSVNGFSVTINSRTPHKERRVEVEIPWPEDFDFVAGRFLRLEYRAANLAPRDKNWPTHDEFMVHVRTENGNLYAGAPMRNIRETWSTFWEPPQNFTLWFYGRANLPWEFRQNRPVSLVLVFYPVALPVTYEFRRVGLVSLAPLIPRASASRSSPSGDF